MPAPHYFQSLDPRLQRWVYRKGWSDLNSLQQNAIPPILSHDKDVVISAATAGGKTEAAFLPALTYIAKESRPGVRILYISPLKALINDQYRRLLDLCDPLDIKVTPWHGDISGHVKRRQFTAPSGVILVTPESLESLGSAAVGRRILSGGLDRCLRLTPNPTYVCLPSYGSLPSWTHLRILSYSSELSMVWEPSGA